MKVEMVEEVGIVIVARVLALACTNEYLLRTMDSLVAVQMIYELKAITEIKTKSKQS